MLLPTPAPLPWRTAAHMVEKHYGHLAPSYVRDVIRATTLGIGAGEEADKVATLRQGA